MTIESSLKFNTGRLPVRDDGALALVEFDRLVVESLGIEYYGHPVVVTRWSDKLKTTLGMDRFSYEDVVGWIEI